MKTVDADKNQKKPEDEPRARPDREDEILKAGWEAMFDTPWDGTQAPMMGAAWDAMCKAAGYKP